jgi:polysaccharide export outer membrane protein
MTASSRSRNIGSKHMRISAFGVLLLAFVCVRPCAAGQGQPAAVRLPKAVAPTTAEGVVPPPGYIIGVEDVLSIVFWRDKDLSADVIVRPDGKISLPLINDMEAAGLTPDQLRAALEQAAGRYLEDPNASVIVKEIRSRRFFITGQVAKPGPYPLAGPTTVLQAIATAGGLLEYADAKHISIMRVERGRTISLPFNYKNVIRRKMIAQNVELKPGDTIVVP